jgi:hypothetical protein
VAQGEGPEFKSQHSKKTKKEGLNHMKMLHLAHIKRKMN